MKKEFAFVFQELHKSDLINKQTECVGLKSSRGKHAYDLFIERNKILIRIRFSHNVIRSIHSMFDMCLHGTS